jgi:hypothetical protein
MRTSPNLLPVVGVAVFACERPVNRLWTNRLRWSLTEVGTGLEQVDRLSLHDSTCCSTLKEGSVCYFHGTNLTTVGWRTLTPFGFGENGAFWLRGIAQDWLRNGGRPRLPLRLSRRVER